jgi:hypothetical protein
MAMVSITRGPYVSIAQAKQSGDGTFPEVLVSYSTHRLELRNPVLLDYRASRTQTAKEVLTWLLSSNSVFS